MKDRDSQIHLPPIESGSHDFKLTPDKRIHSKDKVMTGGCCASQQSVYASIEGSQLGSTEKKKKRQSMDDFFLSNSKHAIKERTFDLEIRKRVQANPKLIYSATPKVSAGFWAIYDVNRQTFIHGKREYIQREVASLTKMMTAYAVLELS